MLARTAHSARLTVEQHPRELGRHAIEASLQEILVHVDKAAASLVGCLESRDSGRELGLDVAECPGCFEPIRDGLQRGPSCRQPVGGLGGSRVGGLSRSDPGGQLLLVAAQCGECDVCAIGRAFELEQCGPASDELALEVDEVSE